jgi:hypothetical protein
MGKMTVRRGMADYRQAGAGGILFLGLLQSQSDDLTYERRRILYRSLYSIVVAKIEIVAKLRDEEWFCKKIHDLKILQDQAGTDYRSVYESHQMDDGAENNYAELLAQILDLIWEISIRAKLIEGIIDDEKVLMA